MDQQHKQQQQVPDADLSIEANQAHAPATEEQHRALIKPIARVVAWIAIIFSIYQLYSAGVSSLPSMQHRAIHLSFALVLVFFLYPSRKKDGNKIPWWDIVCILLSISIGAYIVINYMDLVYRQGSPNMMDQVMAAIATLLVMEASRRSMGSMLSIVAGIFLLYAFFGQYLPGPISHSGFSTKRILEQLYLTSEGIYGVAIQVTATFIFTFILFGSFLNVSGGGKAFIDLAFSLTGRYRGGPAKAAVFASGMMGTISGSSFANVAGTGIFTIPLMKKVGYRPEFAGGVEAAASAGGQLMPPVMGSAAFIMAEMTGIPYNNLIIYAAFPAILYFFSIFLMVDYRAAKRGLRGMDAEHVPKFGPTLKKSIFLLAGPISIFYFLLQGLSPIKASFYAVIVVIVASYFRKETRITWRKFLQALEEGAKGAVSLIAASAVAGIIVGVVSMTGIGVKFANLVVEISNGQVLVVLLLTMIASIILSMGLPTAALYIILATIAAPALVDLGVAVPAAHLFIFYFGSMAAVTPPVALSSYLAATIAKANPVKTAFAGWKLALAAFLLPFVFALNPAMLWYEASIGEVLSITFSGIVGIICLAASLEGYLLGQLRLIWRIVLFAAALLLIWPGLVTDLIGVVTLIAVALISKYGHKKELQAGASA